ncbi:MAG: ATP-binding protein [Nanoarchaeota archaeon]
MIRQDKWIEAIKDFQEKNIPELVTRDINIEVNLPIKRAISLIGPRRAGKTFVMYQIINELIEKNVKKEQILYINFERADLDVLNYSDLVNMLEAFYQIYPDNKKRKIWLFLDEIQNVEGWERFVRTALDDDVMIFLSGSSSRLLSKEIATSMRGRTISYTIFPFSFKEFLKVKGMNSFDNLNSHDKAKVANFLMEYIEYGGYPESVIYSAQRENILFEIKEVTIYRDVIERESVRNVKTLKLLINSIINSKEFSINKFYNFLKSNGIRIGKNVLYTYIEYLNDAFFVFMLKRFSYSANPDQSISKPYFIDNGIIRISGVKDFSRLMENAVFIELYRRNNEISYVKLSNEKEVDFTIVKDKKVKRLIQVCYDLTDFKTKEREISSLIKASEEFRCNDLIIITWNEDKEEIIDGKRIRYASLWKWLLE